jgi:chemotaxis protein methyltransferase CheR
MMKKVVYLDRRHLLGHYGLAELSHSSGQMAHALKSLDNVRVLLDEYDAADIVPGSDGITAGRLREVVVHHQQQWLEETRS